MVIRGKLVCQGIQEKVWITKCCSILKKAIFPQSDDRKSDFFFQFGFSRVLSIQSSSDKTPRFKMCSPNLLD